MKNFSSNGVDKSFIDCVQSLSRSLENRHNSPDLRVQPDLNIVLNLRTCFSNKLRKRTNFLKIFQKKLSKILFTVLLRSLTQIQINVKHCEH